LGGLGLTAIDKSLHWHGSTTLGIRNVLLLLPRLYFQDPNTARRTGKESPPLPSWRQSDLLRLGEKSIQEEEKVEEMRQGHARVSLLDDDDDDDYKVRIVRKVTAGRTTRFFLSLPLTLPV